MKHIVYRNFKILYRVTEWFQRRFTLAGQMMLCALGASAVLGIDTRQTLAYQIFTLAAAVLAVSIAWGPRFRPLIRVHRMLPRFATTDVPFEYRLTLVNASPRPLRGCFFREIPPTSIPDLRTFLDTPEPGEEKRNPFDRFVGYYRWKWLLTRRQWLRQIPLPLPVIAPGASVDITVSLTPLRRGEMYLPGIRIIRPDPLGLFNAVADIPLPGGVVVLPRRFHLPEIHLPEGRRHQSGAITQSVSAGDSEEFLSIRDYRPGDPLRKIHWRTWARTGRPAVKEYQEEFFIRHSLILDTFTSPANGPAFEGAISLAASLLHGIHTQDALMDLMFVGERFYCLTSGRGQGRMEEALKILASAEPRPSDDFSRLLAAVLERAPGLSACVCVFLAWNEERQALVRRMRHLGVPILVFVVGPRPVPSDVSLDTSGGGDDPAGSSPRFLSPDRIQEDLNAP